MGVPLRVLQVVVILDRGGIETMLMNHYRAMNREEIQFDFMVHGDKKGEYEAEILALGGRIHRVRAVKTPLDLWSWTQEIYTVFKNYSVVHCHLEQESRVILYQAKKAGVSIRIAHVHSTSSRRPWYKKCVGKLFELIVPWQATDFFACSTEAGLWLFGEIIVKGTHFHLFKNAINAKTFEFNELIRQEKRAELLINDQTIVMGHVGNFSLAKNHLFLLDTFAALSKKVDFKLLLIGEGALRDSIEAKIKSLNLTNNVLLLGTRNDVSSLMQAMDLFVLPSIYEGLPVVTIEAQCAGLPTLISDKVSKECSITPNAIFLPLNIDVWVKNIESTYCSISRVEGYSIIVASGWDIHDNIALMKHYYKRTI